MHDECMSRSESHERAASGPPLFFFLTEQIASRLVTLLYGAISLQHRSMCFTQLACNSALDKEYNLLSNRLALELVASNAVKCRRCITIVLPSELSHIKKVQTISCKESSY